MARNRLLGEEAVAYQPDRRRSIILSSWAEEGEVCMRVDVWRVAAMAWWRALETYVDQNLPPINVTMAKESTC